MSVVETLLIFVGIPALGFALLAVLVYGGSGRSPRYRPGRGWDHEDVWYLPRPAAVHTTPSHAAPELTAGAATVSRDVRTARGGASGTW